ncbi:MAG TPA: c-type cytochrome [Arenimonas sp.]|uniref:c-type cytochrome n=1 Tax=Arenimonas sp. TaxID=1872635 RepID=UPI002D7E16D5|nr:c-type cytochrome [Arenimonas sp.]HEU0153924.1 c-type cytochrome [Arenimonas sp.]
MGKFFKRSAWLAGSLLLVLAAIYGGAWWTSEQALARVYTIHDPSLVFAGDAAEAARGAHLYSVLGCVECHGADARGKLVFDAGPVARVVGSNLTPAALAERYDANQLAAAIRHGVRADGRALRFMPAGDFQHLSDADTAALVRHLQSLPPSDHAPGDTVIGPVGRVLHLFGKFDLAPAEHIDHQRRARSGPVPGPSAEYGAYLAHVCTGCHGADWAGQRVPGTPPELPPASNLTPHANGLAGWTEADFIRVIREGKRPDGRELHGFMPWRVYAAMTDEELQAIWRHLSTLPPMPGQAGG